MEKTTMTATTDWRRRRERRLRDESESNEKEKPRGQSARLRPSSRMSFQQNEVYSRCSWFSVESVLLVSQTDLTTERRGAEERVRERDNVMNMSDWLCLFSRDFFLFLFQSTLSLVFLVPVVGRRPGTKSFFFEETFCSLFFPNLSDRLSTTTEHSSCVNPHL